MQMAGYGEDGSPASYLDPDYDAVTLITLRKAATAAWP
jgi:hypothetical protein